MLHWLLHGVALAATCMLHWLQHQSPRTVIERGLFPRRPREISPAFSKSRKMRHFTQRDAPIPLAALSVSVIGSLSRRSSPRASRHALRPCLRQCWSKMEYIMLSFGSWIAVAQDLGRMTNSARFFGCGEFFSAATKSVPDIIRGLIVARLSRLSVMGRDFLSR
jgi:hypothetical protein